MERLRFFRESWNRGFAEFGNEIFNGQCACLKNKPRFFWEGERALRIRECLFARTFGGMSRYVGYGLFAERLRS